MGAIWYDPDPGDVISLKAFKKRGGKDPETKRVNYALEMTKDLRERWKSSMEG
jgi:hypothetical protein